jgi:hypothetical protein
MKAILSRSEIASRVERALKALAAQVQPSVPALRCTVEHGGNDSFPWWVVARFANGADESKVADVSIDCRGTPQDWTIRADLARANGRVVRESSALRPSAPANGAERLGGLDEDVMRQLEKFLSEQADCLRQELA